MNAQRHQEISVSRSIENEYVDINYSLDRYTGPLAEMERLFEFLAKTTVVEWGLFKFGKDGIYPSGTLTTSHDESTDVSGHVLTTDMQNEDGSGLNPYFANSDFYGHDHIHPGGGTTPSGFYEDPMVNPAGSGDVGFARGLQRMFPNKRLFFNIYTEENGYIPYDDTTVFDEGVEIKVKPK